MEPHRIILEAGTISEAYGRLGLDADCDLRSAAFYDALVDDIVSRRRAIRVDTDGVEYVVYVEQET